jgi:hypothetical protein
MTYFIRIPYLLFRLFQQLFGSTGTFLCHARSKHLFRWRSPCRVPKLREWDASFVCASQGQYWSVARAVGIRCLQSFFLNTMQLDLTWRAKTLSSHIFYPAMSTHFISFRLPANTDFFPLVSHLRSVCTAPKSLTSPSDLIPKSSKCIEMTSTHKVSLFSLIREKQDRLSRG